MKSDELPKGGRFPPRTTLALLTAGLVALAGSISARNRQDEFRIAGVPTPQVRGSGDEAPPEVTVDTTTRGLHPFRRYVLRAHVDEAATVHVDGERVRTRGGRFRVGYERPPRRIVIVATDAEGNRRREVVALRTRYIRVRGLHVSAFAWATPSYRARLENLIRRRWITTVQLDLKDESGAIGYASEIPLARKIGAARDLYDLEETIDRLHDLGARVVGRLVAFRDPILAGASWDGGHRQRVVRLRDGQPYSGYGGFTNLADDAVRRYNQAIALEAARAGIDDVLYDYVRRPDGPLKSLRFPGLEGPPERVVAAFVAETRRKVERFGTRVGASVYGIAATRPREIGQDVRELARAADYISPMVYPSHWARGEYGVAHPEAQPYKIVSRSLRDFIRMTRGTNARVIPWLQDFSLGIKYGRAEVCAQMQAANDAGIDEWFLWDPHVTYTIPPQPRFCPGFYVRSRAK